MKKSVKSLSAQLDTLEALAGLELMTPAEARRTNGGHHHKKKIKTPGGTGAIAFRGTGAIAVIAGGSGALVMRGGGA